MISSNVLISSNWRKLLVDPRHMLLLLNLIYLCISCTSVSSLSIAKIYALNYLRQILLAEEITDQHIGLKKALKQKHLTGK